MMLDKSGKICVATEDGVLWLVEEGGTPIAVGANGSRVVQMISVPNSDVVYIVYSSGDGVFLNRYSGHIESTTHVHGPVKHAAISTDGRAIAVTNGNTIFLGLRPQAPDLSEWDEFSARVAKLAFTRDGILLVICDDGAIWLHSRANRNWMYLAPGSAALAQVVFDDAETTAFVIDVDGRLLTVDLQKIRQLTHIGSESHSKEHKP
jgi:hypothetical protein